MCRTIVFNWTPVFTLFDRWCYFQCSEVSSCMITVADKSLDRPIKSYFVLSLIYSSGTKCDTPSRPGLFRITSLKISARGGTIA